MRFGPLLTLSVPINILAGTLNSQAGWGRMILAVPLARYFERCVSHERLRQVPVCALSAPNYAAAASVRRLDCADYPRLMLAKPDADR